MRDRPLIQRRLCRHALRKQISRASQNEREMIRVCLADSAIFETVYEEAMSRAAQHAQATREFSVSMNDEGSPVVDNLLRLLTWFVDNGPELIAVIELIVGLFGSTTAVAVICDLDE